MHEDSIKVNGSARAPDYSFRVGGVRKFFVEAKKPSIRLKNDIDAAYQIRRYGWSAKLPLSILTDFEEFAVYDTRVRPTPQDKASTARLLYLTSEQYESRWEEIESIFSRESVLRGSFDRFAEQATGRRGTAEVDSAFLSDIERWRERLARNVVLRNRHLNFSQEELNYSVQSTLDRIIFLRICEDRGLEGNNLASAVSSGNIYETLLGLYRDADRRYNSGLFHFEDERGRDEQPDTLTPRLKIDNKVLKEVINGLYYPISPYEFSVIGADILGRVYEQFLGRTITVKGNRVTVEAKPEVKKAGGVYYTPTFIVDYIVRTTLKPLLNDKTIKQASNLRVVDPACGSGSFLVAAYQYLLDWHLQRYLEYKRRPPQIHQTQSGNWRLTTAERKRILLGSIFGVDIDPQAVEVAKLSLLLKVIEGQAQTELAVGRVLPDLADNVKCGNSVVDPTYYSAETLPGFAPDEDSVNSFDWHQAFPRAFADGGFDAVIGNPPYLNIDDMWGKGDPRIAYLKRVYNHVYNDKTDLLFYFLVKAIEISKSDVCFIVSRAFLEAYKADKLRGWIADQVQVRRLVDFRNARVFDGVGITTAILHLTRDPTGRDASFSRFEGAKLNPAMQAVDIGEANFSSFEVAQERLTSAPWSFATNSTQALLDRIDAAGSRLGDVLIVGQGMQTGRNSAFGSINLGTIESWGLRQASYYRRVRNSEIQRFHFDDGGMYVLYTPDFKSFSQIPPAAQKHLLAQRKSLESRAAFRRGDCDWWQWTWPLHRKYMGRDKLYCPYLANENRFALDRTATLLGLTDTTVLFDNGQPEDLRYIMGLLNSSLLTFRYRYIGKLKSGEIYEYFWNSVSKLPIVRIEPSDARHVRMVALVQRAVDLTTALAGARTARERTRAERELSVTEAFINDQVFDLYDVTEPERDLVRASLVRPE